MGMRIICYVRNPHINDDILLTLMILDINKRLRRAQNHSEILSLIKLSRPTEYPIISIEEDCKSEVKTLQQNKKSWVKKGFLDLLQLQIKNQITSNKTDLLEDTQFKQINLSPSILRMSIPNNFLFLFSFPFHHHLTMTIPNRRGPAEQHATERHENEIGSIVAALRSVWGLL